MLNAEIESISYNLQTLFRVFLESLYKPKSIFSLGRRGGLFAILNQEIKSSGEKSQNPFSIWFSAIQKLAQNQSFGFILLFLVFVSAKHKRNTQNQKDFKTFLLFPAFQTQYLKPFEGEEDKKSYCTFECSINSKILLYVRV